MSSSFFSLPLLCWSTSDVLQFGPPPPHRHLIASSFPDLSAWLAIGRPDLSARIIRRTVPLTRRNLSFPRKPLP
ncbi:MAG: hypothetical protein MI923_28955 [Phycisphaerales bacterium]|nr:hypothetical protein [Phycisphaerales bacterium]